jgi:multicomponent Na+:H+ antiporter subunit A
MAGLPPFNGFLSKEMFFTSVLNVSQLNLFNMEKLGILFPVIAWIASVFTFIYCMILVFKTFIGKHQPSKLEKSAHEPPIGMLIPPMVLAATVILIFFFPNLLAKYIIQPAFTAVLPRFVENGGIDIKISAWHGWTPELFMTMGVVIVGTLMYRYIRKWVAIYRFYPQVLTLNNLFNEGLNKMEVLSSGLTKRYMTGSIRSYFIYIFVFMIFILGGASWFLNAITFNSTKDAPINFYEGGLMVAMVIAAFTVLFSKKRMLSLIAVGALGYLVSMFFVLFRAPDLALTQLVVETVTTALFLLCFYHLPKFSKNMGKLRFKATNLIVSMGVGTIVTLLALSANGHKLFKPIVNYFENAYELAGAKNIVNAILVDFRGFDTLLEISVLCIAGLGVYTLIKLQLIGRDENETK